MGVGKRKKGKLKVYKFPFHPTWNSNHESLFQTLSDSSTHVLSLFFITHSWYTFITLIGPRSCLVWSTLIWIWTTYSTLPPSTTRHGCQAGWGVVPEHHRVWPTNQKYNKYQDLKWRREAREYIGHFTLQLTPVPILCHVWFPQSTTRSDPDPKARNKPWRLPKCCPKTLKKGHNMAIPINHITGFIPSLLRYLAMALVLCLLDNYGTCTPAHSGLHSFSLR